MLMPDVCTTLRFSTDGMPEETRAQAVRELHLHERTILSARLEPIEPLPDYPLHVNRTFRQRYAATPTEIKQSAMKAGATRATKMRCRD